MADLRVKTFQNPSFTEAEWAQRNPYLPIGMIGYEINSSTQKIERYKVGPGNWNDLAYQGEVYPYDDIPTNPIGDANFNMQGLLNSEVLNLMLNPYAGAALSNPQNNAGGAYQGTHTFEVGNSVSGPVGVIYTVSNADTLLGPTPINVTAGGTFTNEGDFPNGQIDLILAAPLSPTSLSTTTISLKATHQEGESATVNTFINFFPQLFGGVSPNTSLTPVQAPSIPFKFTDITDDYRNTYTFSSSGYLYIYIPSQLNPVNVQFFDESPGALPGATIGMEDQGVQTINNGTATYDYQVFRSTFFITENLTIMRLA